MKTAHNKKETPIIFGGIRAMKELGIVDSHAVDIGGTPAFRMGWSHRTGYMDTVCLYPWKEGFYPMREQYPSRMRVRPVTVSLSLGAQTLHTSAWDHHKVTGASISSGSVVRCYGGAFGIVGYGGEWEDPFIYRLEDTSKGLRVSDLYTPVPMEGQAIQFFPDATFHIH